MADEFVRIENDLNEKNCYINVVIQILYHLSELKEELMELEIYKESPQIITQLVLLLSSYSIAKTKKDCILKNKEFRLALSSYFKDKKEFQLKQEGDPIELLQILFNFIHTYKITNCNEIGFSEQKCEPYCLIHKALYIDLIEKSYCCNKNCNYNYETKYDSNYFIHLINVSSILQVSDLFSPPFTEFNEKLINFVNLGTKQCPKCNSSEINFQYNCKHTGKYLILQLIWENDRINFKTLLKILCMINSKFYLSNLFQTSQNLLYSFLGLVLFYSNHYVCFFYEKDKNQFILYDDLNIKIFNTWNEAVEKLLFGHYQPMLIMYENDNNNNSIFNLNENNYNQFLELCKERDKGYMTQSVIKLKNDEWDCENCKTINKNNNDTCKKCQKKNEIITLLIQQEKYLNQNKNSISKSIMNIENKNNLWKCNNCKTNNINDICTKCGKKKERTLKFYSQDYKGKKKYQDSLYNYNNSEENSKNSCENNTPNHSKKSYKNPSLYETNNPFDIPREKTYIIRREKEISFNNIYSNNEKNDKSMKNPYLSYSVKIQNEWKCPFCKTQNSKEKCSICGRRNNSFYKNNENNGWICPNCKFKNPSIHNSICNNCHYLYTIIATMNNQREKIKKMKSVAHIRNINISNVNADNSNINNNMHYNINEIYNIKPIIVKENNNNNNNNNSNIKSIILKDNNNNLFRTSKKRNEDQLNKFLIKK